MHEIILLFQIFGIHLYRYHDKINTKIAYKMRKTVKTVKTRIKNKFSLEPQTQDEVKYLDKLEALLQRKRRGDWGLISEMLSIPSASVEKAFFRVYQKNHFEVVSALEKVINNRKKLIKQ